MRKKTILIIDNDEEIQYLIEHYLLIHTKNIEIHKAFCGEEGAKKYEYLLGKGRKADIVVVDLNLSKEKDIDSLKRHMEGIEGMDGVKTTQQILEIDQNACVIGFTAYADLEWGEKLKMAGAREVIGRYVGFDTFAKKVKEMLE